MHDIRSAKEIVQRTIAEAEQLLRRAAVHLAVDSNPIVTRA
jgi:hypothetical protein